MSVCWWILVICIILVCRVILICCGMRRSCWMIGFSVMCVCWLLLVVEWVWYIGKRWCFCGCCFFLLGLVLWFRCVENGVVCV